MFLEAGKIPCMNDALHMFAIFCARAELSCFTSQVSVRSKEHCFAGDSAMIFVILVGDTGLITSKISICRYSITASEVLSVDCLIFSIFPWKNAAESPAL